MSARTISEKILSARSGAAARAGDLVVCEVDSAYATDASAPMAIDYFERMGGRALAHPERVWFALDHYARGGAAARGFHAAVEAFAARHGAQLRGAGEGISHQLCAESGRALPGTLVIGADSHSITGGALNAFATGVGSSDLAAAMLCGELWFRVPETIAVELRGALPAGVTAKDAALALAQRLGADGAGYCALELRGPGAAALELEDRLVLSNLAAEMGAKAALFEADARTAAYLAPRTGAAWTPVAADPGARYCAELELDLAALAPRIALPHRPDRGVPIEAALGTPVHYVFLGTCTGGRARDFRQALRVLERGGGIAPGVQLVASPASREVQDELERDGTLPALRALGAQLTEPGCGPCCGTAGPLPADGANVISTANRNFRGRMGNARADIYLASPATCAAAAVAGAIADPRRWEA